MIAIPYLAAAAPPWSQYAETVIARLRNGLTSQTKAPSVAGLFDDLDLPEAMGTPTTVAQLEAILVEGPTPAALPPKLELDQVMLAVLLASLFGTAAAFAKVLQPGAMTIITGIPIHTLSVVTPCLRDGFVHENWTVEPQAKYGVPGNQTLLCLQPQVSEGAVSKYSLGKLEESFAEAITHPNPILVLLPLGMALPVSIISCRPATLQLLALDRERLRTILHATVADWPADDQDLYNDLPEDGLIAGLSTSGLRSAFRLPNATDIVGRLKALAGSPKEGPSLDDMAGNGPALLAARSMIADLQLWRAGSLPWKEMTRSMLIYGPPGTGKTWLARAMGNAPGISFVSSSFPAWQAAGHLGDMLAAMRQSFAEAVRRSPCVLFLDEIDAVGSRTGDDKHGRNYRTYVVNGFIQQIDMLMQKEGVLLIGACNFIDRLDSAIVRPGRFDLLAEMPLPTAESLHAILFKHFPAAFREDDLRDLAKRSVGFSAADLDGAARGAKATARAGKRAVELSDIMGHLGLEAGQRDGDWRVCVHEIGHVIVCAMLGLGTIDRVSLTRSGGETLRRHGMLESTQKGIEDELCYALAGRAAEGLVFDKISGGAGGPDTSDLAKASRIALWVDTRFGIGDFGPVWIDGSDAAFMRDGQIRQRVRLRLEAAEDRAATILRQNQVLLNDMAKDLLEQRELPGTDIAIWLEDLIDGRKP